MVSFPETYIDPLSYWEVQKIGGLKTNQDSIVHLLSFAYHVFVRILLADIYNNDAGIYIMLYPRVQSALQHFVGDFARLPI